MGAHVVAHGCSELSERYAGKGSAVGVAMPKAVGGEPRIGLDQRSPIAMAIEVLPEGVPAGFEVLSVQDPDGQLDQPAAELSQSLTCCTCSERARPSLPPGRGGLPLCATQNWTFLTPPPTDR